MEIWQVLTTLAGGLGIGAALTELVKNRGTIQKSGFDELSQVRKELWERIDKLEAKIEAQNAKIEAQNAKIEAQNKYIRELENSLHRISMSYAVFREKVRMMIKLLRANDADWKLLADDIEDDTHEVDALLGPLRIKSEESNPSG